VLHARVLANGLLPHGTPGQNFHLLKAFITSLFQLILSSLSITPLQWFKHVENGFQQAIAHGLKHLYLCHQYASLHKQALSRQVFWVAYKRKYIKVKN